MKLKRFYSVLLLSTAIAAISSCNSKKETNDVGDMANINKKESTQVAIEDDTLDYESLAMRYSLMSDDDFVSFQKDMQDLLDSAFVDYSRNINRETKMLFKYFEQGNTEAARECANKIDSLYDNMAGVANEILLTNAYYRIETHRIILAFLGRKPVWNTAWLEKYPEGFELE